MVCGGGVRVSGGSSFVSIHFLTLVCNVCAHYYVSLGQLGQGYKYIPLGVCFFSGVACNSLAFYYRIHIDGYVWLPLRLVMHYKHIN